MRPPIPTITMSRRAKIALWVVAILIVLVIALSIFSGIFVNWLWYGEVGYRQVYRGILWTRLWLFLIFGVAMALILGGNMVIAYVLRPPFRPMSTEQQNLERYRVMLEPRKKLILAAVSVLALLVAGLSAAGRWASWLLWMNGGSFGVTDPQFHKDISFYAFDYPVYRIMLGFGFSAMIFAIILSVVVHYLTGAIRLQTPGPKITLAARRHLTLLVFVFMVLKAIAYWLDRYGLVFSDRSKFTGASYTDVHSELPAKTILFWIAIVIAVGLIASLWWGGSTLPAIGFVSMLILSILIAGIYPAIVQQVSVKPNASSKEAPYIRKNIEATRAAYGIQTGSNVSYETYNVAGSPQTSALVSSNPTVSNIRILDPNVLSKTFTQQQQISNVYGFASKLDVDRYTLPYGSADGTVGDYIVGVRELSKQNLTGNQANWINQHTVYTHGNGFVAAQANADVTSGKAAYTEANIPAQGPLKLSETGSQVYYGELLPDYSIVGAKGSPQEYNGDNAPKITYAGGGGVSLGNPLTRLAFAVDYRQTNFLLNDVTSASGAKIIYNRDPRERVKKVAPFLTVDSDPYPVVDSRTGHIVWIVDAYTTMSNYPYSERNSLSSLTSDSLSQTGKTAKQSDTQINYIRNSVKATVDAYTGKVTLYDFAPKDPILKAWMSAFPGLVQPSKDMPSELMSHIRYPEDLFEVQRSLLGTYHVDNPVTFYNVGDKWTVPTDPNDTAAYQPPYYVLASPPAGSDGSAQFQLTTPMIVNSKQNLAAYISVDSDPGQNYGRFTVLRVPAGTVTRGPEQVANILNTNPVITKDLSLFNTQGGGSTIVHGNLLTLPIGNSFLYVEPLYVQGATGNGSYPVLTRILAVYGDHIGYAETLSDALKNLSQSTVGESLSTGGGNSSPTTGPTTPSSPTTSPSSPSTSPSSGGSGNPNDPAVVLKELDSAYAALQAAYRSGDAATIGEAQQKVNQLVQKYLQLVPNGATPTSGSSGSSGSGSGGSGSGARPSTSPRSSPSSGR